MVGGAEVLYDNTVRFGDKMRRIKGNRVELHEVPNAPHDILFMGHLLGWTKQADAAAEAAADFLKREAIEKKC